MSKIMTVLMASFKKIGDGERLNFATVGGELAGPSGKLRQEELSREQSRAVFTNQGDRKAAL